MPAKLDRCVADVKNDPGVDNPWAVCKASLKEFESEPHEPPYIKKGTPSPKLEETADDICVECGEARSEHGMFTDHDFQEDVEEFEDDDDLTITIKLGETSDRGPKPMPPVNVVESHLEGEYQNDSISDGLDEAVSIPGSLSGVSIGAKKHQETICPCEKFDSIHKALKK